MLNAGDREWSSRVPREGWSIAEQNDNSFQAGWRSEALERAHTRHFADGVTALVLVSRRAQIAFDLSEIYPSVSVEDLNGARELAERAIAFVARALDEQLRAGGGYQSSAIAAEFGRGFPGLSSTTYDELFSCGAYVTR